MEGSWLWTMSCRKSAVLVCFGKYSGTFHTT
jgi:hypothetical protein